MLTASGFHEDHVLDDGTHVRLRHVQPGDVAELKRGFDRLSPSSRYRRFLAIRTTLSMDLLHYLTCVDGWDHVAIVAVRRATDGTDTGLGIARFIRTKDDPTIAEAALTVIDDVQRRGLGRILALTLARAAIERGVTRFRGEILADNKPIRQLLEDVGAVIRPSDAGTLVFDVELESPEPHRLETIARRLLRAAASPVAGLIRGSGASTSR